MDIKWNIGVQLDNIERKRVLLVCISCTTAAPAVSLLKTDCKHTNHSSNSVAWGSTFAVEKFFRKIVFHKEIRKPKAICTAMTKEKIKDPATKVREFAFPFETLQI